MTIVCRVPLSCRQKADVFVVLQGKAETTSTMIPLAVQDRLLKTLTLLPKRRQSLGCTTNQLQVPTGFLRKSPSPPEQRYRPLTMTLSSDLRDLPLSALSLSHRRLPTHSRVLRSL